MKIARRTEIWPRNLLPLKDFKLLLDLDPLDPSAIYSPRTSIFAFFAPFAPPFFELFFELFELFDPLDFEDFNVVGAALTLGAALTVGAEDGGSLPVGAALTLGAGLRLGAALIDGGAVSLLDKRRWRDRPNCSPRTALHTRRTAERRSRIFENFFIVFVCSRFR